MRLFCNFVGVLLYCMAPLVFAAGGYGAGSGAGAKSQSEEFVSDPVIRAARSGIAKQEWVATQELLRQAIASNPGNADYHNLFAFTTRKGPDPDMKLVFAEYAEALRIDPNHRGAHEYLGEAYLEVNDLQKAKVELSVLDKLCRFGCEEYSELKQSIKQYVSTHPE